MHLETAKTITITDNNFRSNNIIGNELLNETEFRPTNLPVIVSSKKLKAKRKVRSPTAHLSLPTRWYS